MVERLLADLRLLRGYLRLNVQGLMEYRFSFLTSVVFMVLNNAVYMVFWWVFFERFERVGEWRFESLLLLFGMAATSFGLAHVVFGNLPRLSHQIAEGQLDLALSQPKDPLLKLLASRSSPGAWGDLTFGVGIFLGFGDPSPERALLFALLVTLGAAVMVAFGVAAHSLAFWMGGSEGLSRTLSEALLTFALYPDALFAGKVRLVLYTLLPAGFVSYLPVRLLARPSLGELVGYAAVVLAMVLASRAVFARGLARYESGNQMVTNV